MSKLNFILFYTVFLFFITNISALAGQSILQNAPQPPTIPSAPTALDYILYPIFNIVYFFQLMGVSSVFLAFGALILTPFIITMLWAILELIRGV
jgi:hypothetical protein